MKQSPFIATNKIDRCFFCDYKIVEGKYECKKYGHKADNLTQLFSQCRLPEIKEINVWFEKRPPEAKIFDFCVYRTDNKTWPWELEQRMHITEYADYDWSSRWTSETKEFIENLIGCRIPE